MLMLNLCTDGCRLIGRPDTLMLRVETEAAGRGLGGDVSFLRGSAELSGRAPLGSLLLGLSLRGGLLVPAAGTSPLCDRFFLGGSSDVRGFALRGVGPHGPPPPGSWLDVAGLQADRCNSLGGDAFWAAGAHVWAPLPFASLRTRLPSLRTHFFATAGALAARPSLALVQQTPAASCGLGLSLDTGSFTIELNYCKPLVAGPSDISSPGLHFAVGYNML